MIAAWLREHRSIENAVHWVRDVTFDEDRSTVRTGTAPQVVASLRNTSFSGFVTINKRDEVVRRMFRVNIVAAIVLGNQEACYGPIHARKLKMRFYFDMVLLSILPARMGFLLPPREW
ncbi:hypothetical protein [Mycobacterium intracellulare]|uniref:hypothetical protein n=1 Tax=Mycobacterium intracellulare TaxID=1767 RepID=UPI001B350FE2|nr:hypothetical protein [Mycobacterium intracellulare]